jgi:hypothetical protein
VTALIRKISALVAERGIIASLLRLTAIFRHDGAIGVRSRVRFIKRRLYRFIWNLWRQGQLSRIFWLI